MTDMCCPSCRNIGPDHEASQEYRNRGARPLNLKPDGETPTQFWARMAQESADMKEARNEAL